MDSRIDAIYGRQSIDKKDSISIESQFEFCRYELKGGEGKEYKDKGYSGKNIERPDFQRLLQDIRLGLIKWVIVYKLDRISRSIVDFAKLMELFKQYDVEFVSCTEKFDTSTPMGRAMLNICIVFAQLDVLQKPLEVGTLNVLARVALVLVFLTLTAFKLIAAKFKLTFNADTVFFVNRLPPVNCIYSTIHN